MKLWRWFVGQVARLRRSAAGGFASGSQPLHADDPLTFDGRAPGPPEHWVERVRNGAPGLLEPSLRQRGRPVEPPSTNRVALSQSGLEAEPASLDEPERGYVRTEPTVAPQRPAAPVRAPGLRQVLRRVISPPEPARPEIPVETDTNHVPPGVEAATRRVSAPPRPPPAEPDRRRFVAERRTAAPPRPLAEEAVHSQAPEPDKPEPPEGLPASRETVRFTAPPEPEKQERSPEPGRLPPQSEVLVFEAPVQQRVARTEQAASPAPAAETGITRPSPKGAPRAELAADEITTDLFLEQADPWPSPAPIRGAEHLPQRLVSPRRPPPEASVAPVSPTRRRAEPLSEAGVHPWPELPPPLDRPDSDVEAALRAWEHQRRLDHEQTRL